MILRDKIPSIYHSLFPELLNTTFPEEKIATCDTCTLCRSTQSPYINTKCCTYHPHLANFLIGGVFCEDEKNLVIGQDRIRDQIVNRAGVTPYGIIPSVRYSQRQKSADTQDFWSRSQDLMISLRCPYYDDGNCTVWKYRENLCVTHFCSSVGGGAGDAFWKKLNQYLKMAETSLSQYAMLQLGWRVTKIKTKAVTTADFNFENEEGNINEAEYKKLWGDWAGKEEAFYKDCYGIIKDMNASTFKRITGLNREILEASILDTNKAFQQNVLADILLLNPGIIFEKIDEADTRLVLGEASAKVPTVFVPLIRGFNGKRTTVEAFQLGYNLLFNMSELVDELREKGMLIKA
jgi:hypothetical protein